MLSCILSGKIILQEFHRTTISICSELSHIIQYKEFVLPAGWRALTDVQHIHEIQYTVEVRMNSYFSVRVRSNFDFDCSWSFVNLRPLTSANEQLQTFETKFENYVYHSIFAICDRLGSMGQNSNGLSNRHMETHLALKSVFSAIDYVYHSLFAICVIMHF